MNQSPRTKTPALLASTIALLALPILIACSSGSDNGPATSVRIRDVPTEIAAPVSTAASTVATQIAAALATPAPTRTSAPASQGSAPAATATTAPVQQAASSSAPAPSAPAAVQGSITLGTGASCSSTNGVARVRITGIAAAVGSSVKRVQIFMDGVSVSDSGDVSGQAQATLNQIADLQPSAGSHAIRITADSTGGASAVKSGTVTISGGSCSSQLN